MAMPAIAQIDSDPTNDAATGADAFSLSPGTAISNSARLAATGNDSDFFSISLDAGGILLGLTTPLEDFPVSYANPDTIVSVMQDGIQLTYSDDDFADEIPDVLFGLGSIFRVLSSSSGPHQIGISGYGDEEFDGMSSGETHEEVGTYVITVGAVDPAALGGGFMDSDPANDTINGADAISIGSTGAAVAVAELQADDIDYYALQLSRGQIISAMTAPLDDLPISFDLPDTLFGLFDSTGELLISNDDAGDDGSGDLNPNLNSDYPASLEPDGIFGSAIRAVIPLDGVYYLGVTGFGDDEFEGTHAELGRYAMLVGVSTPPPSSPGDFNRDGLVNAADYVRWRNFEGPIYSAEDYETWRANFEISIGAGVANNTVPEPELAIWSALCLFFMAAAIVRNVRQ
jgi:hypothetical protein